MPGWAKERAPTAAIVLSHGLNRITSNKNKPGAGRYTHQEFRSCIARLGRGRRSQRDLEWKALENRGVPPELACSCHKACTTLGLNRNEDSEQLFVPSWKALNLSSQSAGPF